MIAETAANTIDTAEPSTITPANSGVVLYVAPTPPNSDAPDGPVCGYVRRLGGGVPWLKPRQCVVFNPRRACYFGPSGETAVVDQRDILGVVEGVFLARNCSCDGVHTGCTDPGCPSRTWV